MLLKRQVIVWIIAFSERRTLVFYILRLVEREPHYLLLNQILMIRILIVAGLFGGRRWHSWIWAFVDILPPNASFDIDNSLIYVIAINGVNHFVLPSETSFLWLTSLTTSKCLRLDKRRSKIGTLFKKWIILLSKIAFGLHWYLLLNGWLLIFWKTMLVRVCINSFWWLFCYLAKRTRTNINFLFLIHRVKIL